jgi:hypothetical protein
MLSLREDVSHHGGIEMQSTNKLSNQPPVTSAVEFWI